VAMNKADYKPFTLPELRTSLPAGLHLDELGKLVDGVNLQVDTYQHGGGTISRPTVLPPHSVSVWQAMLAHEGPAIGNIEPPVAQPGVHIKIYGTGFGEQRASVELDGKPAQILKWSPSEISAIVPQCDPGHSYFEVIETLKAHSQRFEFTVLKNHLVPVTFTVKGVPPLNDGERIFLNGDGQELGEWKTEPHVAAGPLLEAEKGSRFLTVSLPAGASISYQFFRLSRDGNVTPETVKHSCKVGTSGPSTETVTWSQ
ncbi:MAG TPA: carbohydrate-binding module family 20 domain-containing protein, partial [Chroococcales cyanobacterium]